MLIVTHTWSKSIPTKLEKQTKKISETRTTASALKQDPNTQQKVQRMLFIGTKHNLQIFRVFPFIKQQNDT